MKKYKVSFFAVLMTLSTTVAFGVNSTLNSDALGNALRTYVPSNVNLEQYDLSTLSTGDRALDLKIKFENDKAKFNELVSKYSGNTSNDESNIYKDTSNDEVKYNNTKVTDDDTDVNEKLEKLEKKRDIAHGLVSGASSAMTGIGGMEMAQAISEQKSDADAEEEMGAYLTTFKCDYGKSQKYDYSTQDIILPGGNELVQYYTEYKTLADQLKADKTALGLTPGIESQVVYDKAESGLYKNAATGNTGGKYTSLSRALLDENSEDAAEWAEQKDKTKKRLQIGATVAAAGLVAGFVGDKLIDKHYDKLEEQELNTNDMFKYIRETIGEEEYDRLMEKYMKKKGD